MLRADSPSRAPPGHYREFYPLHDFQTPFLLEGKIHILKFCGGREILSRGGRWPVSLHIFHKYNGHI